MLGDNLLTALNVARSCGIIPKRNKVILPEAFYDGVTTPKINWKYADDFTDYDESIQEDRGEVSFIMTISN